MKIAMIGHKDFPSRSGGVEVVVYELSTRLAARGHEVTVYNRGRQKGHNAYLEQGVRVKRVFTFKKQILNAMVWRHLIQYSMILMSSIIMRSVPPFHCFLQSCLASIRYARCMA